MPSNSLRSWSFIPGATIPAASSFDARPRHRDRSSQPSRIRLNSNPILRPRVRCGSWLCENSSARRARRNISKKLRTMESNRAARTMFDTLPENCIFYISPMYEFSHRLGQKRPKGDVRVESDLAPIADVARASRHVAEVPIVLQKSPSGLCEIEICNNRIGAPVLLNRCCAFQPDLESIFLAEMLKILLQHNLPIGDLSRCSNVRSQNSA